MKEDILRKSLDLFLKHGVREMSNQKLVELLGISTKTLYKYFKNKEELLEEVLFLYHGKQYEIIKNLSVEQSAACAFFDVWRIAIETEHKVNKDFYCDLRYYYPEVEKKVNSSIGKKFEQFFLSIIERGIEQGAFRKEIVQTAALKSVFVLHNAVIRSDQFDDLQLSTTELLLNTIGSYIRGLCTVSGLEALEAHIRPIKRSKKAVMA